MVSIFENPEILEELLNYDCVSGDLIWKYRGEKWFNGSDVTGHALMWNRKFSNKKAFFCKNHNGYFVGSIFNKRYLAHRVAWAIHFGAWPSMGLDHIDGNKNNNKIENLRLASSSENNSNRIKTKSGLKGAYEIKNRRLWKSQISFNRKITHLGTFKTEQDAHDAYCLAAKRIHGEFARFA